MLLDDGELVIGEPTGLVQDLFGDVELADVMEQPGPAQLRSIGIRELQLLTDQFGVRPDPFAVASGQAVVSGKRRDEHEKILGRLGLGVAQPLRLDLDDGAFEFLGGRCPQGEGETVGCLVGEDQREAQQQRQRKESACHSLGGCHDEGRQADECGEPGDGLHRPGGPRQQIGGQVGHRDRDDDWSKRDRHPQTTSEYRPPVPSHRSIGARLSHRRGRCHRCRW